MASPRSSRYRFTKPSPPRYVPAPPESGRRRYSITRKGVYVSRISTGVFIVLDVSVATQLTPSALGRAPLPPDPTSEPTKGLPVSSSMPPKDSMRGWPLEQAGMLGTAWARAPSSASHVRRHVMERAFTAAGKPALTTLFSGRSTSMQRYVPERSEEHTSELQSRENLVCRLLLEKK